MNIFQFLAEKIQPFLAPKPEPKRGSYGDLLRHFPQQENDSTTLNAFVRFEPLPGVIPVGEKKAVMAMDSTPYDELAGLPQAGFPGGVFFPGFQSLAAMSMQSEQQRIVEAVVRVMTSKGFKLVSTDGGESKTARIAEMMSACEKMGVNSALAKVAKYDAEMGRGHVSIQIDGEVETNSDKPLKLGGVQIKKGSKVSFVPVEPYFAYPAFYQSTDPTKPNFYKPDQWYVMTRKHHESRLLTFVSREVPDIFKPAYAFSGLSIVQIVAEYVKNFRENVDNINRLLRKFSLTTLSTDMSRMFSGDDIGSEFKNRIALIALLRDNHALHVLDNDGGGAGAEKLEQLTTSLAGLAELLEQGLTFISFITGIPALELYGDAVGGLNGGMAEVQEMFAKTNRANQARLFDVNLKIMLDIVQLATFGDIDPTITHQWNSIYEPSKKVEADTNQVNANTIVSLVTAGIIETEEARERLAADESSGFQGLDTSKIPDRSEEEMSNA